MSDAKLAKADAKAAKAKAKALRPWFKKKRFILPIALVAIIGISVGTSGGSGKAGSASSSTSTSTDEKETLAGIGSAVVDGKFEFTVTAVKCGIKSVGTKYLNAKAQGQFCQVSLTIKNIGDEAQTMFADNQKAFDGKGREFETDTASMIYLKNGSETWLNEINPGNTVKGALLFDISKDTTLETIELHDSAFSGGVTVSLK